jgi:hypothetical protein
MTSSASSSGTSSPVISDLFAADATYAQIPVYLLDQCVQGIITPHIGDVPNDVPLTTDDCRQLLTLDPFYVNGQHFLSQNAPPNNTSPWGSYMTGNTGYGIGNVQPQITIVQGSGYQGTVGTSASTTITAATGNTTSFGLSVNAFGLQVGYNDTVSNSTTTGNTNSSSTSTLSSTNNQVSQTASVKLVAPIEGQAVASLLFVDNRFGTIMFPDYSPAANQFCQYSPPTGGSAATNGGNTSSSTAPTSVTGINCVATSTAAPPTPIPWHENTVMVLSPPLISLTSAWRKERIRKG